MSNNSGDKTVPQTGRDHGDIEMQLSGDEDHMQMDYGTQNPLEQDGYDMRGSGILKDDEQFGGKNRKLKKQKRISEKNSILEQSQ